MKVRGKSITIKYYVKEGVLSKVGSQKLSFGFNKLRAGPARHISLVFARCIVTKVVKQFTPVFGCRAFKSTGHATGYDNL